MTKVESNLTHVHLYNGEVVEVDRQQLARRLKFAKFAARANHIRLGEIGPIGLSLEKAMVLLTGYDLKFADKQ